MTFVPCRADEGMRTNQTRAQMEKRFSGRAVNMGPGHEEGALRRGTHKGRTVHWVESATARKAGGPSSSTVGEVKRDVGLTLASPPDPVLGALLGRSFSRDSGNL